MTIKQLSIFIENRSGALLQILEMLRDNGFARILQWTIELRTQITVHQLVKVRRPGVVFSC